MTLSLKGKSSLGHLLSNLDRIEHRKTHKLFKFVDLLTNTLIRHVFRSWMSSGIHDAQPADTTAVNTNHSFQVIPMKKLPLPRLLYHGIGFGGGGVEGGLDRATLRRLVPRLVPWSVNSRSRSRCFFVFFLAFFACSVALSL